MLAEADAALMIGDKAIEARNHSNSFLDLAEEWIDLTNLPFVFALWVGNRGKVTAEDLEIIEQSKQEGHKHLDEIIHREAEEKGYMDEAFYRDYMTSNIRYELTETRLEGLKKYYEYAFMLGLIPHMPEIVVYGQDHATNI